MSTLKQVRAESIEFAAQIWARPENADRVMDVPLAQSIAQAYDERVSYVRAEARAELAATVHGWGCPMPCHCGELRQIFEYDLEAESVIP